MIVRCPHCGKAVPVNGLGRPPINIPVKNICDAIQAHGSVAAAAKKFDCSPGYIFNTLKANGRTLKDVLTKYPKQNSAKEEMK